MNEADLKVMEALVKTEHWMAFRHWQKELLSLIADYRYIKQRMTEMAVEHVDAVTIAYHDGAKEMRDRCAKALAGSYDAGAESIVVAMPLPERIISIL